jgi:ferritin
MKLPEQMEKALNDQVTMELASAASYLQIPPTSLTRTWMG